MRNGRAQSLTHVSVPGTDFFNLVNLKMSQLFAHAQLIPSYLFSIDASESMGKALLV
jgi:hypothetical protein